MKIKARKFTYCSEKKRLPNGKVTTLEYIQHPGATLIIPFRSARKVVFLKQYRAAVGKYIYELPAGTLERKEKPLVCARRELIEETGLKARTWTALGTIYPLPGYSTEIIHIYKAEDLSAASGPLDDDEILKPITLSRTRVRELFKQKKILDAKTICALVYCGWL